MKLFKRKERKIIAAICPDCGGHLKVEDNSDTAVCPYCKTVCILTDILPKKTALDKFFCFVERQQKRKEQKRIEKQKAIEEENRKKKEHIKKYWWAYLLGIVAFATFIAIMCYLEK